MPIETDLRFQLREHYINGSYYPLVAWSRIQDGGGQPYYLRTVDDRPAYGHVLCSFPAEFLKGKYIKFRWRGAFENAGGAAGSWNLWHVRVYDGKYDRATDSDFPTGSFLTKGNSLLQTISEKTLAGSGCPINWGPETLGPILFNFSNNLSGWVTLFFIAQDNWVANYVEMDIDWIEILDVDAVTVLYRQDFNIGPTMEKTGSYGDYGYEGTYEFSLLIDIPDRVDDIVITDKDDVEHHLKGVKDAVWKDSDPWVQIPIPFGNMLHHHLLPNNVQGVIRCMDIITLYAIFYETLIDTTHYAVTEAGEKTKFSVAGDQFQIYLKTIFGTSYRFDFYDVRVNTIELENPESAGGGENCWVVRFTARKVVKN